MIRFGFKVLSKDMKAVYGDGMQYEMHKRYELEIPIVNCHKRGFHYFNSLMDAMRLYDLKENRVFICIMTGNNFDHDGKYHCCDNIKLIREISQKELSLYVRLHSNKLLKSNNKCYKLTLVKYGYKLDKLINNCSGDVRCEVACQGFGLDVLVHDKDWYVRREVARQGYGLDKLLHDENWCVRCEVVRQGFGLDKLLHDEDYDVRCEVVRQGYGLDKLLNDEDWHVRLEVACQGFGLDRLLHDENWHVRCEVARQGFGLDKLLNDEDRNVRLASQKQLELQNKYK